LLVVVIICKSNKNRIAFNVKIYSKNWTVKYVVVPVPVPVVVPVVVVVVVVVVVGELVFAAKRARKL